MKLLTQTAPSRLRISPRLGLAFGALALIGTSAQAQLNSYLVRGKYHEDLRHMNYLSPEADAVVTTKFCRQPGPLVSTLPGTIGLSPDRTCAAEQYRGGAVLRGDFDGDGRVESAWRTKGGNAWRLTNGERYDDGRTGFYPLQQSTVRGDFDGDGVDEIAWRRNGSSHWVINDPADGSSQTIHDGFTFLDELTSVQVGDFDCDDADDIAWRTAGQEGWVVNSLAQSVQLIMDQQSNFDPSAHPVVTGDFDGDGCKDIAWRTELAETWNVNSAANPLWNLADPFGEGFTPDTLAIHVGDFDGDSADDIAWRPRGEWAWYIDSVPAYFTITDGDGTFGVNTVSVVGDFDGDGADDLAWRPDGWTEWHVNSYDEPLWYIFDGEDTFEHTRPIHVGDFDGNGKDDISWLYDGGTLWQIDTEGPIDSGVNPNNWQEDTHEPGISMEMIYTDVDGDEEHDDLVILVMTPEDEAFMLYRPLSMAYFLKSQGMTVTEEFYSAMSTEQQETWYLDSQTPEQQSSFTKQDPNGPNHYPNVTWNSIGGNVNLDDINEMSAHASWSVLTLDKFEEIETGELELRILNFKGGFFGEDQGAGFFLSYSVAEGEYTYGPVTGDITIGQLSGEAWVSDSGFVVNAGVTLVAVGGQVGDEEGTHVSGGVGFGVGADVGAKWGDNDQYGLHADVKFLSFGVYVKGEDAEMIVDESKDWVVGAWNETEGWTEGAWHDTVDFFDDVGDGIEGFGMSYYDELEKLTLSGLHPFEDVEYTLKSTKNAIDFAVNEGEPLVNGFLGGLGGLLDDSPVKKVDNFLKDDSNPIGKAVNFVGSLF